MTDNITVAMVMAARDLAQQALSPAEFSKNPDHDAETIGRVYKTIYRAIAESVYHHSGSPKK